MAGKLFQRFLSFFTVVLLARYLGPEQYGQYTFVIAVVTLIAVFWNFGLNTVLTRDVARNPSLGATYTGAVILGKTGLFLLAFPCIALFLLTRSDNATLYSVLLFATGTFLGNISGAFNALFAAHRRMDFSCLLNIIRSTVLLIAVILILKLGGGLLNVFVAYFLSFVAVLITAWSLARNYFERPVLHLPFTLVYKIIKASIPFFLTSAVNLFLFRVDHIMLAELVGDVELGLYGSAYTLFEVIISLFPMLVMASAFPVLSCLFQRDIPRMKELYDTLIKYFILLSLPISAGIVLLGTDITRVLYGAEYAAAGPILSVLGLSVWIFFFTILAGWTLTAADKQKTVFLSNSLAMVINIIFNFLFIPTYGAIGAAAVTAASGLFQLVFMALALKRLVFPPLSSMTDLIKAVLLTAFMSIFLFFIRQHIFFINEALTLSVLIFLCTCFFFSLAFATRALALRELRFIMKN